MARSVLTEAVIRIGPLNFKSTVKVGVCVQCQGPTNLRTLASLNKGMDKIFRAKKDSRYYIGNSILCSSNCIKAFLLAKAFELKYTLTDSIQEFVTSPNDNTHFSTSEKLPYTALQWVRDYNPVTRKIKRELKELVLTRTITLSTYGPKEYPYVLITTIQPETRSWYTIQDSNVQFFNAESFETYKNNLNTLVIK